MTEPVDSPIWQPGRDVVETSNIKAFIDHINAYYGLSIKDYDALHHWSVTEPEQFWERIWHFTGVLSHSRGSVVIENPDIMEKARFFPYAQLNYAENLLRRRDQAIAIEFFGEDQVHTTLTYQELYQQTCKFSKILREWGVRPGDRVVGYIPNMPQAVVAMLATASLGAIWAACSPEYGFAGVVDRLEQINPKVLLMAEGYYDGGKYINYLGRIASLRRAIPSIEHTVVVGYHGAAPYRKDAESWDSLLQTTLLEDLIFSPWPFLHPLFILFSSGTSGAPKCVVHSAGGTLLQHLKESELHYNIKPNDCVFFHTTCSLMAWNCVASILASQARIVLYDGSPFYPKSTRFFDIVDQIGVTILGFSPKFIERLDEEGLKIIQTHDLSSLRMIITTGSPLRPECYEYVYKNVKKDVCLSSVAGGTEIISCFVLTNPIGEVWSGEIQVAGLGLKVEIFDEKGNALPQGKGELVCTAPFPSQPLGFWNDLDGKRYHQTYFTQYPNVWKQGDFVERTVHGGYILHGRSDSVLVQGGKRIGTAEIYRPLSQIDEVMESLVVGQEWKGDIRIILFVKLRPSLRLVEDLVKRIKHYILQNTTANHVPEVILQVRDIPRTGNGKISESVVREIVNSRPVESLLGLANPEVLAEYKTLAREFLGCSFPDEGL